MVWRVIAPLALAAWGAFAFGAVYPWAFAPLFAGAALAGLVTCRQRSGNVAAQRPLAIALLCLVAAILVQLIPLPIGVVRLVSSETDAFLRMYDLGYPHSATYALSVRPASTLVGLAAASSLGLLLLGLGSALRREDTVLLVRGLCGLGVLLALVAMLQMSLWNGKIYGFWTPLQGGNPFGPFVNRNHFAGWMLMALPLATGYFCGRLARGTSAAGAGWRNAFAWWSTPDASETVLVGSAVFVMALALVLTTSRSGILGLIAALAITTAVVSIRQRSISRRMLLTVYMGAVLIGAIAWAGVDPVAARFANDPTYGNRIPVWLDTLNIAARFPLAGTGLNTFGVSTLHYQKAIPSVHLAEAHNDYLQLLAEGGALLTVPAFALVAVLVQLIRRRLRAASPASTDYWIRTGAATGVLAIGIQEIGEFSLQMPGNALLFVLLLAIAIRPSGGDIAGASRHRERPLNPGRT